MEEGIYPIHANVAESAVRSPLPTVQASTPQETNLSTCEVGLSLVGFTLDVLSVDSEADISPTHAHVAVPVVVVAVPVLVVPVVVLWSHESHSTGH